MTKPLAHNPLRIGIDGRELMAGTVTGFGRYLENFLDADVTRNAPHQFIIYGNQHSQFPRPHASYTCRVIEEQNTLWWDQVKIVNAIAQDHIDLFFTPYDKIPIRAHCPVVMTIHDLLYQYVSDLTGIKRLVYNTLYKMQRGYMARNAARVLTVSEHSRQDIARYYGLDANQIVITYNAVSNRFHPNISQSSIDHIKSKYGLTAPYIFNLNNFKPHKNPQGLIEAYAQLPESVRETWHLAIGGKHNAFTPALQERVQTLDLSHCIHFPGMIDDEDLPAFYAGADLFVITSFYEGFGIPPLEAMACGTPIVSSNATSLPEVVGTAGPLVAPHDTAALAQAMVLILEDENVQKHNIQKGLEQAQNFTQEKTASKILHALEETAKTCNT